MKQRLTLIEKIELAWHEWNDAIAGLGDADFEQMVYRQWNLKDVMGHVFAYLDLALRHVKSFKKQKRLAFPDAPSYAFFNRREAERLRSISLTQLRAQMDDAYQELIALVPTLSSDDLNKRFPSQWTNSKYTTSLRNQLRETAGHMQNHADEVRAWRNLEHVK